METKLFDCQKLSKYTIQTSDDKEIGKIKDIYLDDKTGHIRYFVVDTETFLMRNLVLVSPISIKRLDEIDQIIELDLTAESQENSPKFNSVETISRLYEKVYNEYFSWPNYWESLHGPWVLGPFGIPWRHYETDSKKEGDGMAKSYFEELEKCHLRSLRELRAYHISTEAEQFGHIKSAIFETRDFKILYWVVDTISFFPSKLVLLPFEMAHRFYWRTKTVEVESTKEIIKQAPSYHSTTEGVLSSSQAREVDKYFRESA